VIEKIPAGTSDRAAIDEAVVREGDHGSRLIDEDSGSKSGAAATATVPVAAVASLCARVCNPEIRKVDCARINEKHSPGVVTVDDDLPECSSVDREVGRDRRQRSVQSYGARRSTAREGYCVYSAGGIGGDYLCAKISRTSRARPGSTARHCIGEDRYWESRGRQRLTEADRRGNRE
jgi:hypothetical protein